jgi:hypothetical protein
VSRAACVEEKHELELRDWDGRRLSLTGLLRTYDDDAGDVNRDGGGALRFLLLCPAGILDDIVKERSQLPVLELRVEKARHLLQPGASDRRSCCASARGLDDFLDRFMGSYYLI